MNNFGIAMHGGAGVINKKLLTAEKEKIYCEGLKSAVDAGYSILEIGGSSLDAVEAAVIVLENHPLFNAGKGSVFNHEGKHEMDASI
ncbi:MAG: isoaspartyl peptidase/L-asparaginase, partial [Chitinophagales bacterium]